jgi:hypothetical protein
LFRHDLRTSRPAKWRIALIRSTTSSANALDRNRAIGHGLASEPGGGNMRCAIAVVILSLLAAPGWAAPVNGTTDSLGAVSQWISNYRGKPQPARLPAAVRALSQAGAFKDPESSGVYVGFMAGVIGANPARAKELIAKSLAIHPADHWALVRAIAYSGLPEWKSLLEEFAGRMPTRKVMIEKYLAGELPTLAEIPLERRSHSLWEKMSGYFTSTQPDVVTVTFDGSPELLDTLWGYYFATGSYTPIGRMVTLLPWSTERDSVEKLTIGGMAKYTLVSNAARDPGDRRGRDHGDHPRAQGCARRDRGAQAQGPALPARNVDLGADRAGSAGARLHRRRRDRPGAVRIALRARRRRVLGGVELLERAVVGRARQCCDALRHERACHRRTR